MSRYTLHCVQTSGGTISGITDFSISDNAEDARPNVDGQVDPLILARMGAKPTLSFTTHQIATALGVAGLSGLGYSSALTAFFQNIAIGGTRGSGSNHVSIVSGQGLVVPQKLSASQGGLATLSYLVVPYSSNGTTHPLAYTASAALSGTAALAELYTVGKVSINGSDLNEVQSIEIDFGIKLFEDEGESGLPYPEFVAIDTRNPTVKVTTLHADYAATYGNAPVAADASDIILYFRKLAEGGVRVADGTEEHVSLTIDEGYVATDGSNMGQGEQATVTLMITPTYDGTNDIIAIDTTAAIA